MFKKRGKVAKQGIRKSRAVEEEDVDESDGRSLEAEQLELIREMREEQKERRRVAGVDATKLLSASELALREKQRKLDEEAQGTAQQTAGPDMGALITNQFQEQTGVTQSDDKVHEKRMEAFIDEQMGVKKEEEIAPKVMREEDKLYIIEDVVKGESDQTSEGGSGNAAPLFMGAGLAEVALPMDFRLKNIQRTQDAKVALLNKDGVFHRRDRAAPNRLQGISERGLGSGEFGDRSELGAAPSGRYGGTAAMAGGSFNSNFNTHRREWAVMMKSKDQEGGQSTGGGYTSEKFDGTCNICGKTGHRARDCGSGGGARSGGNGGGSGKGGGKGGGKGSSSDDRAFEQYKKRARR